MSDQNPAGTRLPGVEAAMEPFRRLSLTYADNVDGWLYKLLLETTNELLSTKALVYDLRVRVKLLEEKV